MGLGDTLVAIAQQYSDNPCKLARHLHHWRDELWNTLCCDPQQHLGRHYQILANKVPQSFPSTKVLDMYLNPLTLWSDGQDGGSGIPSTSLGIPDIRALSSFCRLRFGWSPEYVHQSFRDHVWQGAFLHMLCGVRASYLCIYSKAHNFNYIGHRKTHRITAVSFLSGWLCYTEHKTYTRYQLLQLPDDYWRSPSYQIDRRRCSRCGPLLQHK